MDNFFTLGCQQQQVGETRSWRIPTLGFRLPVPWWERVQPHIRRICCSQSPICARQRTYVITLTLIAAPQGRHHSDENSELRGCSPLPRFAQRVVRGPNFECMVFWAPRTRHIALHKAAWLEREWFQVTVHSWFKEGKLFIILGRIMVTNTKKEQGLRLGT